MFASNSPCFASNSPCPASKIRTGDALRKLRTVSLAFFAIAAASLAVPAPSGAATFTFNAVLDGPSESPPVASPGTGSATVVINDATFLMSVSADFAGLLSPTTVAHIHCCTAVPFASTVGVATTTPTFPGFPVGVMSGSYGPTIFNMLVPGSYSAAFLTANGGNTFAAFAALLAGAQQGRAYFNIHTDLFPTGEIRGFLVSDAAIPLPAALPLFGAALGMIGLLGWRRRKAAVAT
jgi:CHRD domain-containing protein